MYSITINQRNKGLSPMSKAGILGTTGAWLLNFLAWAVSEETLRITSYYLAIMVSVVTIAYHLGNMFIRRKEFFNAVKEYFKRKRKGGK